MSKITTIIFDLDGVLLDESAYWEVASQVAESMFKKLRLHFSGAYNEVARGMVPLSLIDGLKERGINSNWELTDILVTAGMALGFLQQAALAADPLNLSSTIVGSNLVPATLQKTDILMTIQRFWKKLGTTTGHAVMDAWAEFLSAECPALHKAWTTPELKIIIRQQFQNILTSLAPAPASPVDTARLWQAFDHFKTKAPDIIFGVATGRPKQEAIDALMALNLLSYFSPHHIVTYDNVLLAEQDTRQFPLSKPHPYCLLQAAYPDADAVSLCHADFAKKEQRGWLIYVGDAGSDILTAQAAQAVPWMVLSGCADAAAAPRRQQQFAAMGAKRIYPNVLDLMIALQSEIA